MIDILMWLNNEASSSHHFKCTTSWPAHCDSMIIGLFAGYRVGEYGQIDNCAFGKCDRGPKGNGSGEFVNAPLAACRTDFVVSDFFFKIVPYTNKLICIGFVELHFRWQKSLHRSQFGTFKAIPGEMICPSLGPGAFSSDSLLWVSNSGHQSPFSASRRRAI
jgi:hypothetical protein